MSHDCDMSGVAVLLTAFGLCFSIVLAKQDVVQSSYFAEAADLLLLMRPREWLRAYTHVWPEMEFGWKIVVGTLIGFFGSGFGTVGGVGGGGIFVPMLTLIIGFDSKTSIAISKCMITGGAAATVYYNLKRRHPTLDLPLIDYDLALLAQPMLVLGISIGVTLNVILAEWMITVLLIILFLGTSIKAFLKGIELWKKETLAMKEAESRRRSDSNDDADNNEVVEYQPLPEQPDKETKVSVIRNVRWRELAILFTVWAAILALQIVKDNVTTCSVVYWVVNLSQIPVAVGASTYETVMLYKGNRVITSRGDGIDGESGSTSTSNLRVGQLVMYCLFGLLAGIVGGLLGLGGGFILGPLFLELGIPPQVSSATATFAMTFSASMSAVEYYLLKRFPLPYTLYFVAVATVAALAGQYVVRRLIVIIGRASLIIFILAFTIFVSAISLGGVGILDMIDEIKNKEYMGFESLCSSS